MGKAILISVGIGLLTGTLVASQIYEETGVKNFIINDSFLDPGGELVIKRLYLGPIKIDLTEGERFIREGYSLFINGKELIRAKINSNPGVPEDYNWSYGGRLLSQSDFNQVDSSGVGFTGGWRRSSLGINTTKLSITPPISIELKKGNRIVDALRLGYLWEKTQHSIESECKYNGDVLTGSELRESQPILPSKIQSHINSLIFGKMCNSCDSSSLLIGREGFERTAYSRYIVDQKWQLEIDDQTAIVNYSSGPVKVELYPGKIAPLDLQFACSNFSTKVTLYTKKPL